MTFEQWKQQNPRAVAGLTPGELKLMEIGWMAGWIASKVDSKQLEREPA